MNDYTKMALGFAAGFIIGIALIWIFNLSQDATSDDIITGESTTPDIVVDADTTDSTTGGDTGSVLTEEITETSTDTASVIAGDQPAGASVRITSAQLPADGWIVVHEERDGFVGNALGAVRRDSGTYTDVAVPLLRDTVSGARYWVVLYTDDGDRTFSLENDFPVRTGGGEPVTTSFTTN